MDKLSPMMQQYLEIKSRHTDHIVFFRLGDFYEMFFEDAVLASKELELTLTGRDCGLEERAPMCGVPHHSCEAYIARLIKKGYKVAICEQLENPAQAKGVVKRDIVRIITPGTLIESAMLDEGANNYICSVYCSHAGYGLAFADISTGQVHITELGASDSDLINELGRFAPSEIIFNSEFLSKTKVAEFIKQRLGCTADLEDDPSFSYADASSQVLSHFNSSSLELLGLTSKPLAVSSLGGLISYLSKTQRVGVQRLMTVNVYGEGQYMNLDLTARRNLEITETMRSREKKGTLLWVLDKTQTSMGKRLIKAYIEQPLINPVIINKRLAAVDELYNDHILSTDLTEILNKIYDLERLMTRIVYGSATPRELRSLCSSLEHMPKLKDRISSCRCNMLTEIYNQIDPLHDLFSLIDSSIDEEPPISLKDGGVIKRGFSKELDEIRFVAEHTKDMIAAIEQSEREKTGIKNLKIGYNKVFGYYIEVTHANAALVPETYIRKQTLTNCERYITQQLKELEDKVLTAHEKILELEAELYDELRRGVASQLHRVQTTAAAVAKLDVLLSFAYVSSVNNYYRPEVNLSSEIVIKEGRHPVVEQMLGSRPFVPNDIDLNNSDKQIAVITGPNMAGKSTYMRQAALIVLMAQIGCFVPAKYAEIGVVDGIYTRVGASDDLASGQSTFMVEMSEVASILKNATAKSLLILDEIGRGTSTFDGMSIARAVIEYIADRKRLGAKTLFATHYHELTVLEKEIGCVKNYNIAVKKRGDDITFLRRIVPGGADDSYGIEVSKLAGIPEWIIKRAKEVLEKLEDGKAMPVAPVKMTNQNQPEPHQLSLGDPSAELVAKRLKAIDLNTITAIEGLNILYELKKIIEH